MLTLIGPRPALCAASIPSSTSPTAKSTSFMRLKVASSSESSDTVTRFRPASFSDCAFFASSEPLVVSVRSSGRPLGVRSSRQHADQPFEVLAQQRFAAGQADLFDAVRDEQAGEAGDFLERQQRGVRQVGVVLVEHFLRHAVHAAEIAAVGDGDAQVVQRARERVAQQAGGRFEDCRNRGQTLVRSSRNMMIFSAMPIR